MRLDFNQNANHWEADAPTSPDWYFALVEIISLNLFIYFFYSVFNFPFLFFCSQEFVVEEDDVI